MKSHLERLADHLESLDSGSKDAAAIRWTLAQLAAARAVIDAAENIHSHECAYMPFVADCTCGADEFEEALRDREAT